MAHILDMKVSSDAAGSAAASRQGGSLGNFYVRYLKRALVLAIVLATAPFVLPLIGLLALLVRRDGGTAFYSHDRIGRNGEVFRFWKLRSMVVDADAQLKEHLARDPMARAEWARRQKLHNDPRITEIGRLLRRTSLDELPQLWNVLKGDMSLVGPRPMMPDQRMLYPGKAYFDLRPGLTGFWQVSGRNDVSFARRALYDTLYANRLSLLTDLTVLLLTIRVVVRGTGH
jgi:lipopolysaccharide/colanic/teichoic acid biosynthesis glycosyltransferase